MLKYADDDFDLDSFLSDRNDTTAINLSWKKNSHKNVTHYAIEKLRIDRPYITNKMESERSVHYYKGDSDTEVTAHYIKGTTAIWVYSYYTDAIENQNNTFSGHFYDPDSGTGYNLAIVDNAYTLFNNHFYNAYNCYRGGAKTAAYREIGMCVHYLEDMNCPYHTYNKNKNKNTNHTAYELWAKDAVDSNNILIDDIYSTYRFMYDNSFIYMARNFTLTARNHYDLCNSFSNSPYSATTSTIYLSKRAQRSVAGLLNRFYYTGWLNH